MEMVPLQIGKEQEDSRYRSACCLPEVILILSSDDLRLLVFSSFWLHESEMAFQEEAQPKKTSVCLSAHFDANEEEEKELKYADRERERGKEKYRYLRLVGKNMFFAGGQEDLDLLFASRGRRREHPRHILPSEWERESPRERQLNKNCSVQLKLGLV